jgi:enoyl-CoA hydratase
MTPQADSEHPCTVSVEVIDDGIVVLRLSRPKRLNALTQQMISDAISAFDDIASDDRCRVVILTGEGRAFCAGADFDGFDDLDPAKSSIAVMKRLQERTTALLLRMHTLPQPVIAAVNGPAAGGGLALALAADTRICSESARFNVAFVRLGLSGSEMGVSYLLPRVVGPTVAFELMLSGRFIDASEAVRIGLVLEAVSQERLLSRAVEIAQSFRANSPIGLRMTKELMWAHLGATNLSDVLQTEGRTQLLCGHTADHQEALRAFLEGRDAEFENR